VAKVDGATMKTLSEATNKKRKYTKLKDMTGVNEDDDDKVKISENKKVKLFDKQNILNISKLRKKEFFDENYIDNFCYIKRLDEGLF
jgi:hypothetical protein